MAVSKGSVVRFKNELNKTSQNLDPIERRVVLSAISQINYGDKVTDEQVYYVTVKDLELLGSNPKHVYQQVKRCSETLFNRFIRVKTTDADNNPMTVKLRWIQRLDYVDGTGRIGIRFSKDVLPYLSQLQEQFTSMKIIDISGLNSSYAMRLYEILMQYQNTGKVTITLEDLRFRLDIGDKYQLYNNFKRIVLQTAINQINEGKYTRFTVSFKEKKLGRKVHQLIFTLSPKNPVFLTEADDPSTVVNEVEDIGEVDLFSGLTIREATLSPSQQTMFSDRLAGLNVAYASEAAKIQAEWLREVELKPYAAQPGESQKAYASRLQAELKNPEFVMKIAHYLRRVDFRNFK